MRLDVVYPLLATAGTGPDTTTTMGLPVRRTPLPAMALIGERFMDVPLSQSDCDQNNELIMKEAVTALCRSEHMAFVSNASLVFRY